MREELKGIDYVFYFQKQNRHTNMIDLTTNDTVENTGQSWGEAAYGNALISLNISQITDALYLIDKKSMKGFNPVKMNREKQRTFLKSHAKRIITRKS